MKRADRVPRHRGAAAGELQANTAGVDTSNAAVTFADLAGFTALTEAHGDITAADVAEQLVADAESVLGARDRVVKSIGDAVMLASVDAASAITLIFRLFDACERDARFPDLRAGLHYGPVVERNGDVFGTTVNVAARLAAQAGGGQILATGTIAGAAPSVGVEVRALGSVTLRNLSTRIELFKLVRNGPDDRDVDPVCRMRLNPATAPARLTYAGADYLFCSLQCAGKFAAHPAQFAIPAG